VRLTVEDKIAVNLVGTKDQVVAQAELGELREVVAAKDAPIGLCGLQRKNNLVWGVTARSMASQSISQRPPAAGENAKRAP